MTHAIFKRLVNRPLGLLLAGAIVAGCGGSNDEPAPVGSNALSGVVVDGYVSGATVFLDLNNDRVWNEGEPRTFTDGAGAFSLDVSAVSTPLAGLRLVATGGVDTDLGVAFTGRLTQRIENRESVQVLSPLNTLAETLVSLQITPNMAAARQMVANAFGLSASDLELDPMQHLSTKPALYANQVALQQAVQFMAAENSVGDAPPYEQQHRIMEAVALALRDQNGTADLGALIRTMTIERAMVVAQFADRLRTALQLALQDPDPVRQRETTQTMLQTMTQLREQLQDCDTCQMLQVANRVEQQTQLQAGALVGLVDDDRGNDEAAMQLIRNRNQAGSN